MSNETLPAPEIDAEVTCGAAVCQILSGLLGDLIMNASCAMKAQDIEYLHDFRVAIRRMRTLVAQFREIMPDETADYLTGELRWLGQLTGPLRDADGFLAAFDDYCAWLPEPLRFSLQPVQEYLQHTKKQEQEKFIRALMDSRYAAFIASAQAFVAGGHADWNNRAWSLYVDLAGGKIWRLYRKMLRQGNKIDSDSPASALHELRKDGKKLRYLTGFFEKISPAHTSPELSKQLRRLQNVLGDHQDFEVQAEALMQASKQLMQGETALPHTYLATGILIGRLNALQAGARAKFDAGFNEFSRKRTQRQFRTLYKNPESKLAAII